MPTVWIAFGTAGLVAHLLGTRTPGGAAVTVYATVGALFLGLGVGAKVASRWPPTGMVSEFVLARSTTTAVAFWSMLIGLGAWALFSSPASAPWSAGLLYGYATGLAGLTKETKANRASLSPILVGGLAVLVAACADPALRAITLETSDTVADYRDAGYSDTSRLLDKLCANGECLRPVEWACGFTNGEREAFEECFERRLSLAAPSATIDSLRKYCGNATMRFKGAMGEREKCEALGGSWGVKPAPPDTAQ